MLLPKAIPSSVSIGGTEFATHLEQKFSAEVVPFSWLRCRSHAFVMPVQCMLRQASRSMG